jgi:hypothetical protein
LSAGIGAKRIKRGRDLVGIGLTARNVAGKNNIVRRAIDFIMELSFLASIAIRREESARSRLI